MLLKSIVATAALATFGANAADFVTQNQDLGTLSVPSVTTISHSFSVPLPVPLTAADTFYDNYAFHISGADVNAFAATLDLGNVFQISNLQLRLYAGALPAVVGPLPQPALQGWTAPIAVADQGSATGHLQVIAPLTISAGDYVLQVRGNVTGAFGGAYVGAVNLGFSNSVAVVPEPETYALFFAGLAGIGMMTRKRMRG